MATAERTQPADSFAANLSLGTSVLLFAYVAVAVLKQADAELILPSSTFDVGGLLDRFKDGIPGGAFVAPVLQFKVPLYFFYTLGPFMLLALHAVLVLHPRLLRDAAPPLRFAAIWLPPLTLALIMWRFSPYVAARPKPPPLLGRVMEALQTTALAADSMLVILALIRGRVDQPRDEPEARGRGTAELLRAARHAGLIWLVGLLLSDLVRWTIGRARITDEALIGRWGTPVMWSVAAALLTVWLAEGWFVRTSAWPPVPRPWYQPSFMREDLDMQGRILIASIFLGLAALPALGRGLDLSGESLVARAPTETMMAALIVAKQGQSLAEARETAWTEYGRGIDLARWRFDGTRFDRATMAKIRLSGAKLASASLDYTNLIKADLSNADLTGASLRYSDLRQIYAPGAILAKASLRGADLTRADLTAANFNFSDGRLAQAGVPSATQPAIDDPCKDRKLEDRANLSDADLSGADLTGADLRCSILQGITMNSATKLGKAKLAGANFCGANLSGVDFSGAEGAERAFFAHTDLTKAKLPRPMSQADLEGAFGAGVHFEPGSEQPALKGANLKNMNLYQLAPEAQPTRLSHCK